MGPATKSLKRKKTGNEMAEEEPMASEVSPGPELMHEEAAASVDIPSLGPCPQGA